MLPLALFLIVSAALRFLYVLYLSAVAEEEED